MARIGGRNRMATGTLTCVTLLVLTMNAPVCADIPDVAWMRWIGTDGPETGYRAGPLLETSDGRVVSPVLRISYPYYDDDLASTTPSVWTLDPRGRDITRHGFSESLGRYDILQDLAHIDGSHERLVIEHIHYTSHEMDYDGQASKLVGLSLNGEVLWTSSVGGDYDLEPHVRAFVRIDDGSDDILALVSYTDWWSEYYPNDPPKRFLRLDSEDGTITDELFPDVPEPQTFILQDDQHIIILGRDGANSVLARADLHGNITWLKQTDLELGYRSLIRALDADHEGHIAVGGAVRYYSDTSFVRLHEPDGELRWNTQLPGVYSVEDILSEDTGSVFAMTEVRGGGSGTAIHELLEFDGDTGTLVDRWMPPWTEYNHLAMCLAANGDILLSGTWNNLGDAALVARLGETAAVEPDGGILPDDFAIEGIYPNPFNQSARLQLRLNAAGWVEVTLVNMLGQRVGQPVNSAWYPPGSYSIPISGARLRSGSYLVQVTVDGTRTTRRIQLVR